jgi:N-acetylmuramoyl-L-alanine amidase
VSTFTRIIALSLIFFAQMCLAEEREIIFGFDGMAEFSTDVGDFGATINGAAVLTCGGSLNCGPFPPFSGNNVIFDNYDSGGEIRITFNASITGKVTKVSGRVTGNTNITLTAFDSQGAPLASDSTGGANYVGSGSNIPANKLLTVESEQVSITTVVFHDSGNTFTIDNLSFTRSPRKVVVDAGHGSINGNFQREATSNLGLVEDKLTLDMAVRLETFLTSNSVSVVQTRTSLKAPFAPQDCGVPCGIDLRKRRDFAKRQEPDVFVSIHTNGSDSKKANGTETYYNPGALSDDSKSRDLATKINSGLAGLGLRDRGVKTYNHAVTRSDIPSALTEVAFHSNTELATGQSVTDEIRLGTSVFLGKASTAIGTGIISYLDAQDVSEDD